MSTTLRIAKIFKPKKAKKHLKNLQKIQREKHHPLIHKLHHVHKFSKRTLFYVKEYGSQSNVPKTILKESIKIILFASIISSLGGLALEEIKQIFISMIPLVILLPTLNDMVGDYGTIVSSRFSTMLHKGEVKKRVWQNPEIQKLFLQIVITAFLTAVVSAVSALGIAAVTESGRTFTVLFAAKVFVITIIDVLILVLLLFVTAIGAGLYYYKKKEDPNNFLIPITTSVADLGNMLVLAVLVVLFF